MFNSRRREGEYVKGKGVDYKRISGFAIGRLFFLVLLEH